MAAAEESSSASTQQPADLDPIMLLAQDMFHKTADYLNGEFDSTYSLVLVFTLRDLCLSGVTFIL